MNTLEIINFKCFESQQINLKKVTVLTGTNGSGKSSVIQALLLLREIIQQGRQQESMNLHINLNNEPRLRLGDFDEIIKDDKKPVRINLDGYKVYLDLPSDANQKGVASAETEGIAPHSLEGALYYLNAERIGPRLDENIHETQLGCGDLGEATGSILLNDTNIRHRVDTNRSLHRDTDNLQIAVDQWMSLICGDASFKPERLSDSRYRLKIKRQNQRARLATNTGFGYTYALPIIVTGLIAQEGSLFIVENPEAHLHPKAQSDMGFFLGRIAATGVQLVIETHSEHIINGLRRASLSRLKDLSNKDLVIYFFDIRQKTKYTAITMDSEGNLSDYPVDFFDQVRQDMLEIIRLTKTNYE